MQCEDKASLTKGGQTEVMVYALAVHREHLTTKNGRGNS